MEHTTSYTPEFLRLLDSGGRVRYYPMKKRHLRQQIFRYVHSKFPGEIILNEKEVNEIIKSSIAFEDYAIIRRELVEARMLFRTTDGSEYRKG